jgi:hypothetical protein
MTDPIGDLNRMQAVLAEYEAINSEREHGEGVLTIGRTS